MRTQPRLADLLNAQGSVGILNHPLLGLCCSRNCPGRPILLAYDLAVALRNAEVAVIGGFHTSVEKDCLDFLLKGTQPVVVVPARASYRRIPANLRAGVDDGRVTIVYPFAEDAGRLTAKLAARRNEVVDSLASAVFVIYAEQGGETWERARRMIERGMPVFTFAIPENEPLVELGAVGIEVTTIKNPAELRSALGL